MKRVRAACICQTLHFLCKDEMPRDRVAALARQEVDQYKKGLEHNHVRYKILEETEQPDGSLVVKVIKQYNGTPTGSYLD